LVEINRHAIHIVPLRFLRQQIHESLLLLLDVDWIRALAHATLWVRSKTKEVTEDI